MEAETVETTQETVHDISADGRRVTETVRNETPVVVPTDETRNLLGQLADRLAAIESQLTETGERGRMAEPTATETVVESPPPEKAAETPKAGAATETPPAESDKPKKRHAGFFF